MPLSFIPPNGTSGGTVRCRFTQMIPAWISSNARFAVCRLVVQIEAPPSAASGLQRVGRAGHQVGEVSRGWFYPKHRGDLLDATVTVERMLQGRIEPLAVPLNPLDVLAQQTVTLPYLGRFFDP